jgi:glycosyltransferase involved in cell wall biosynthesis
MPRAILQLISSAGLYGAERVLLELGCYLRDQGWRSHVCVLRGRDQARVEVAEEARRLGLSVLELAAPRQLDTGLLRRLSRFVDDRQIDVVHSHAYKTDVTLALATLPRATCRVATCHTWYTRTLRLMAYELLDKIALHRFDHVVVVSPQLLGEVTAAGIPRERSSLIGNGVSAPSSPDPATVARLRTELAIAPTERMVLRVGRLDLDKGNHVLLRALARLPADAAVKLVLAGDGDQRRPLEALARELGISDRVVFAGYRRDVAALLGASDLFVISSPKEGLPMVLLEAMAARVPVLSTAVGAIPSVIDDGVDGLLVPPDDPARMAEALIVALRSPERLRQLAESAHRRFLRDHSQRAMGQRYEALYESLLARREG